jgi:large repetitive protein
MSAALSSRAMAAEITLPSGAEIRVNVGTTGMQTNPQVAVFADGGFAVAWTVGTHQAFLPGFDPITMRGKGHTVIHARFFSSKNVPTSGEFLLVDQPGSQMIDAVVADGNDLIAVWDGAAKNLSSVFVGRFDRTGRQLLAPLQVNASSPWDRYGGRVALDQRGGFAISWTADFGLLNTLGYRTDTYARRFKAGGEPVGSEFVVFKGDSIEGTFATAAGLGIQANGTLIVAVWYLADTDEVLLFEVSPSGTVSNYPANWFDQDFEWDGAFAMAADGSFVAAWSTGSIYNVDNLGTAVEAATFGSDGALQGSSLIQVNRGGSSAVFPWLVGRPDGAFVAVWTEVLGRDGSGFGVFGRSFGPAGAAESKDFQVNQTTAGDQIATAIASNAAGDIVVVWESSSGPDFIAARRLASTEN